MTGTGDLRTLEHIARKAKLMHDTANRYCEINGGSDTANGEVWQWIASTCDLVRQLAEATGTGGPT